MGANLVGAKLELEEMKFGRASPEQVKHTLELDHLKGELSKLKEKHNVELNHLKVRRDCLQDVVLEVQGQEILAHKIILADKSPVFQKMFESGMLESQTGKVQMEGASHAVIEAVVNFCYTGEISFVDSVPPDEVLKIADMYDIQYLKNICESECCKRRKFGNWPQLLKIYQTFGVLDKQQVWKYFKEHFHEMKDEIMEDFGVGSVSVEIR